jgi:hypothetical protein
VAVGLAFAQDVMGWDPRRVHVRETTTGTTTEAVDLWNLDMTSTFTPALATTLVMDRSTGVWVVLHVESGLFDVTCPSPRQDVLVTASPGGSPTIQKVCGTFTQPPAGWIVQATIEQAGSNLQPSKTQSTADVTGSGQEFIGSIRLNSTYAGQDVSLQIRVYSGSGATLGLWARRFVTAPQPSPSPSP